MKASALRKTFQIRGVVQGVGFRPTVLRLARESQTAGWVQNTNEGVFLAVEGTDDSIQTFLDRLRENLPPHASIESIRPVSSVEVAPPDRLSSFSIRPSSAPAAPGQVIPPDLKVCDACLSDVFSPSNPRFGYPFTTCTHCGPRYTVIRATPYDRARTSLSAFPLCPSCRAEYENPENRRFHAETVACPVCGPRLSLADSGGRPVAGDPIRTTRQELARGAIFAVKGIGGFLLAADAFNRDTLSVLRERKRRPHKPFAVMAADLDTVRRFCGVTPEAEELLVSPESPIVILDLLPEQARAGRLPLDLITPDGATLGVLLPTSPLHQLLFTPLAGDPTPPFEWLVMTSGNRRGEPICVTDDEARARLSDIADFLLAHNRDIRLRNDDSLGVIQRGAPQIWRRARGYAPLPLRLPHPLRRPVLAMGADLKNTLTLAYDRYAVLSPHVGDMDTPEALESLTALSSQFPEFYQRKPEAIAVDLHPDMQSTRLGARLAEQQGIPLVSVQHHHAHAVACLAEHGRENGLALVFDGTGLGDDGAIWGAELLHVEPGRFRRLASFAGVPLPGGDAAVRHPVRQLVARFNACGIPLSDVWRRRIGISETEADVWIRQCREHVNAPITHAAGRVFDSFSVLLGVAPPTVTYEGQAAIRLESAARNHGADAVPALPFDSAEKNGMLFIDWAPAFRMLAAPERLSGREPALAMALHQAVAEAAAKMVEFGLSRVPTRTVALSGGVFMNRILNDLLVPRLEARGLEVLIHRQVPPNDGGLSLGQALVAGQA